MEFANAKAVFFDMDNTLYDFEQSMEHAFLDLRVRYPEQIGKFGVERISRAYWSHYENYDEEMKYELIHKDADLYRRTMWSGCLRGLGFDVTPEHAFAVEVTRFVESERPKQWYTAMYAGVHDALATLKRRHSIGVITNGPAHVQRPKLRGLRYQEHFAEPLVFVSGEFGVRKPDPSIFLAAAKAAGVEPHECVMVGDAREFDMPAKAVGFRTILFDGKKQAPDCVSDPYPPDMIVCTYAELMQVFGH